MLPLVYAAAAGGGALALKTILGLSLLQAVLAGTAIFCILMVVTVYSWVLLHTRQTRAKLDDFITFENDVLRRLPPLEQQAGSPVSDPVLTRRLDNVEILAQKLSEAIESRAIQKAPSPDDFEDEKIVKLTPANHSRGTETSGKINSKAKKRVIAEKALNEWPMTIRLQPILNLIDRKVVAVEAFAFFKSPDGILQGNEFLEALSDLQRSLYDLKVILALSKVAHSMEGDNQVLPIQYRMMSLGTTQEANWLKTLQTIEADPRLSKVLIPVASTRELDLTDPMRFGKILALRQLGLEICLTDMDNSDASLQSAAMSNFNYFKLNAQTLLQFESNDSERKAERILPVLANYGHTPFIDGIDHGFQASQLIDLDITAGQGDYISPARPIRLYKEIESDTEQTAASRSE